MQGTLKLYVSFLSTYLRSQRLATVLMAVLLLINIALNFINPLILQSFIDELTTGKATRQTLLLEGLAFITIALLNQGIFIVASYLSVRVAWTATNRLRYDLMRHCLALDMSFYKERTVGELIERIDGDVETLSNFFSQFVVNTLSSLLLLLGIIVLFFRIDWRVGGALFIFSLFTFVVLIYLRRRAIPLWKEQRQKSARFYGLLSEWLTGTEDLRANGAISYVLSCFTHFRQSWLPVYKKASLAGENTGLFTRFMSWLGSAISLALGAYLWSLGLITVGTIYLIYTYTNLLSQPIEQLQHQLQDLQQAEACIIRVYDLLKTRTLLNDGPGTPLTPEAPAVTFKHITFGYNPDKPVVQDITFEVPATKTLGIVGLTGSGKTTLARLLFRFYDPQQGEICLSNVPIREAHLYDLRQHIGMVTQDVQIFKASVRDNLTFFDPEIPDEQIVRAIEEVGLADWFSALPDGLDTLLKAQGGGLSSGEAQLLVFARIFLNNPGLLILDEASSRLDPATEQKIKRVIDRLLVGRTAIVIAHRLTTLQRADDVLLLEGGRILEHGPREMLAQNPNTRFSQLLRTGLEEDLN
ncbi:MAG TPA: ABC transporter ATP-binding protein [Ktedonobacteraceae bacterium]|nr:ABC transporter ATP-binding protein [Ktedonobacteraceae bacterium]